MIKSYLTSVSSIWLFLGACVTGVNAQERHEFDRKHFENVLPESAISWIRKSPDKFLKNYARQLFVISSDGVVTAEKQADYKKILHASARAKKISEILKADIDGDGVVERAELTIGSSNSKGYDRANVALQFLEADVDSDGRVTFAEISTHADEFVKNNSRNRNRYDRYGIDVLMFDINGDNSVGIEEVSEAINIITGDNKCSEFCKP